MEGPGSPKHLWRRTVHQSDISLYMNTEQEISFYWTQAITLFLAYPSIVHPTLNNTVALGKQKLF